MQRLVTIAMISYNQEGYIGDAVTSLLEQDYPNLEVLIADDCSSDRTYEMINELLAKYDGPHKVRAVRHEENKGMIGNINYVLSESRGDWIVMAAGDDVSLPDRVSVLMSRLGDNETVFGMCSNCTEISGNGEALPSTYGLREKDMLYPGFERSGMFELNFMRDNFMWGAMAAWKKEIVDTFGPLNKDAIAEDHYMTFRAKALGNCLYVGGKPLVKYRKVGVSSVVSEKRKRRDLEGQLKIAKWFCAECEKLNLLGAQRRKMRKELEIYDSLIWPQNYTKWKGYILRACFLAKRIGRKLLYKYEIS